MVFRIVRDNFFLLYVCMGQMVGVHGGIRMTNERTNKQTNRGQDCDESSFDIRRRFSFSCSSWLLPVDVYPYGYNLLLNIHPIISQLAQALLIGGRMTMGTTNFPG